MKRTLTALLAAASLAGCTVGHEKPISIYDNADILVADTSVAKNGRPESLAITDKGYKALSQHGVPRDVVDAYDHRLYRDLDQVIFLHRHGVSPAFAETYLDVGVFDAGMIVNMQEDGVDAATYSEYGKMGIEYNRVKMFQAGLTPDKLKEYDRKYWDGGNVDLLKRIPAEKANQYAPYVEDLEGAAQLIDAEFPAKLVPSYPGYLPIEEKVLLYTRGVSGATASSYWVIDDRGEKDGFNGREIERFVSAGASPDVVRRFFALNQEYGVNIGTDDVVFFVCNNVPYEQVRQKALESATAERIIR